MPEPQPHTRTAVRHRRRLGRLAALVTLGAILGALGACGESDEGDGADANPFVAILRPNPESDTEEVQRREGLPVVEETDRLEGLIVNPYDMEVGGCFNSYLTVLGDNQFQELTTVVDCTAPHDGEVYFKVFHPAGAGEPYPGPDEMFDWAEGHCYEQFERFVGQEYELSELDIGILHPTEITWSDPIGRHREVTCYVEAWRGGRLLGSMRGSGF